MDRKSSILHWCVAPIYHFYKMIYYPKRIIDHPKEMMQSIKIEELIMMSNKSRGFRPLKDLTERLATRADDSHATPVNCIKTL